MRYPLNLKLGTSRFARILALAALLCAVGIPAMEAGHQHHLGDTGGSECLLYKSPALLPMVGAAFAFSLLVLTQAVPRAGQLRPALRRYQPRQTRGPPPRS